MRAQSLRAVLLVALLAGGVAVFLVAARRAPPADTSRLTWAGEAHQFGPVGYRDPAGAISPDGRWLAYSEGRFLRVRPIAGGPLIDMPAGEGQIRTIVWSPESKRILADGFRTQAGWAVYDLTGARAPLFGDRRPEPLPGVEVSDLRQPAWSPDGHSIAAFVNGRDGQDLWTIAVDGSSATP